MVGVVGALVVIVALAIALFYFSKGRLGGHVPYTGRKIERFTHFERSAHWANAIAFSVLAISGLVMAFGKFLLLPLIGHELGLSYSQIGSILTAQASAGAVANLLDHYEDMGEGALRLLADELGAVEDGLLRRQG